MRFRFILSHESAGSIEIDEPIGWVDAIMKLERHEQFHSLIEYFDGSFILYGDNGEKNGGISFVKAIERDHGVDATLLVDIDLTYDEETFTSVFNGQYKIADLEEMPGNKMRIPIIRDDFWAKFIARIDTPVDIQSALNLDDNIIAAAEPIRLRLTSQPIRMQYRGDTEKLSIIDPVDPTLSYQHALGVISTAWTNGTYFQVDTSNDILDEIEEKFSLPVETNPEYPVWLFDAVYAGTYTFDIRIYAWEGSAPGVINPIESAGSEYLDFFVDVGFDSYQMSYSTAFFNGVDSADGEVSVFTFSAAFEVAKGTRIRIYGKANRDFSGVTMRWMGSTATEKSYIRVTADTIHPESTAEGFLLHDVGAAITDRIIGESDTFYSELLGAVHTRARQYEENGCAWIYSLIKGLQIRGYELEEKPFAMSFMQWWKGIDPILCLSLTYDEVDGRPVIRVDKRKDQYDDEVSVNFSNVMQITRKYDPEKLFNKIEVGYSRWQAEEINGIDDPQTKRTYADRFKKVGKPIQILSEFIAASLAIEGTRRKSKLKTTDYKFDNESFIIAINPIEISPDVSPDIMDFEPELDENFASVTNILYPSQRYNLRLSAGRSFVRHLKFLQGGLQDYIGSEFKFTSGEGNYDMTSEMIDGCDEEVYGNDVLDEKGNIPVTSDYLHLAMMYEVELPMEWSEYETIRDNRRKAIGISQTDTGHVPMFIKDLQYKPAKGSCTMVLWAREYLELGVVEDIASTTLCYVQSECEGGITDDLGEFLTDELGVCITD